MKKLFILKILVLINLIPIIAFATDRTWKATANSVHSTTTNWSPNGTPGASDNLFYNPDSSNYWDTIKANSSALSLRLLSGYTGGVFLGTNTLTIGDSLSVIGGSFQNGITTITLSNANALIRFASTMGTLSTSYLTLTFNNAGQIYHNDKSNYLIVLVNIATSANAILEGTAIGTWRYGSTKWISFGNSAKLTINTAATILVSANMALATVGTNDTIAGTGAITVYDDGGAFRFTTPNILYTGTGIWTFRTSGYKMTYVQTGKLNLRTANFTSAAIGAFTCIDSTYGNGLVCSTFTMGGSNVNSVYKLSFGTENDTIVDWAGSTYILGKDTINQNAQDIACKRNWITGSTHVMNCGTSKIRKIGAYNGITNFAGKKEYTLVIAKNNGIIDSFPTSATVDTLLDSMHLVSGLIKFKKHIWYVKHYWNSVTASGDSVIRDTTLYVTNDFINDAGIRTYDGGVNASVNFVSTALSQITSNGNTLGYHFIRGTDHTKIYRLLDNVSLTKLTCDTGQIDCNNFRLTADSIIINDTANNLGKVIVNSAIVATKGFSITDTSTVYSIVPAKPSALSFTARKPITLSTSPKCLQGTSGNLVSIRSSTTNPAYLNIPAIDTIGYCVIKNCSTNVALYLNSTATDSGGNYNIKTLSLGIDSIVPNFGVVSGGTNITIYVKNGAIGGGAMLGGTALINWSVVDKRTITATTQASTLGWKTLVIWNDSHDTLTVPNAFIYGALLPDIDSISPTMGTYYGGTWVRIRGQHFSIKSSPAHIDFGDSLSAQDSIWNDTLIISKTRNQYPIHDSVYIRITDSNNNVDSTPFVFYSIPIITSNVLDSGDILGGYKDTIRGTGFETSRDIGYVSYDTVRVVTYYAWNDTMISVLVPYQTSKNQTDVIVCTKYNQKDTLVNAMKFYGKRLWASIASTDANNTNNYRPTGSFHALDYLWFDSTCNVKWKMTSKLSVYGIHVDTLYRDTLDQNNDSLVLTRYFESYSDTATHIFSGAVIITGNNGWFYLDANISDSRSYYLSRLNFGLMDLYLKGNYDTLEIGAYAVSMKNLHIAYPSCTTMIYRQTTSWIRQAMYIHGGMYLNCGGAEFNVACLPPTEQPINITEGSILQGGGALMLRPTISGTYDFYSLKANSIFGICPVCPQGPLTQNLMSVGVRPEVAGNYTVNLHGSWHVGGTIIFANPARNCTLTVNVDSSLFTEDDAMIVTGATVNDTTCKIIINYGNSFDTTAGVDFGRQFLNWPDSGKVTINLQNSQWRLHGQWYSWTKNEPTINAGNSILNMEPGYLAVDCKIDDSGHNAWNTINFNGYHAGSGTYKSFILTDSLRTNTFNRIRGKFNFNASKLYSQIVYFRGPDSIKWSTGAKINISSASTVLNESVYALPPINYSCTADTNNANGIFSLRNTDSLYLANNKLMIMSGLTLVNGSKTSFGVGSSIIFDACTSTVDTAGWGGTLPTIAYPSTGPINYDSNTVHYKTGVIISSLYVTNTGCAGIYTKDTLPVGLTLNSTTGAITGMPIYADTLQTIITATAHNITAKDTITFNISLSVCGGIMDSCIVSTYFTQCDTIRCNYLKVSTTDSSFFNKPVIVRDSVIYSLGSVVKSSSGSAIWSTPTYTLVVKLNGIKNTPMVINKGSLIKWK